MKIIPAIDLKDNKCVRLSKGEESSSKIFNKNPIKQAKIFEEDGCERIHIIDLDAAFGRPGINKKTILDIRQSTNLEIELGGGIRTKEDIVFWLEKKIDYLIIGSFASKESSKLKLMLHEVPDKVEVMVDRKKFNVFGCDSDDDLEIVGVGGTTVTRNNSTKISKLELNDAKEYLNSGEFPEGSMGPKVEAMISVVEKLDNCRVLLCSPGNALSTLRGESGTHIF